MSRQVDTEDIPVHTSSAKKYLYTSHFLSTWNSRLFEFGAFLFLASLYPSTLLPASVYALAREAAGAVLSPWVGGFIDRNNRLYVVRLSISGQRLSVILSCGIFAALASIPDIRTSTTGYSLLLTVLAILACLEKLAIVMNTISVERDWVVVIAGRDEIGLNNLNSRMRRIDLFCKLIAPLAISFIDAYSTNVAIICTALLSASSWIVEYFAIARVYRAIPGLQTIKSLEQETTSTMPLRECVGLLTAAVTSYVGSSAALPSMSLSLLYLTALSFNGQLITYLLAPPVLLPAIALSIIRGIAACAELSATFLGPALINRIGPLRSGSWFLNGQLLFVVVAASTFFLPDNLPHQFRFVILLSAIILSRIGLWGFDLAAQQQIQDTVPEDFRGSFSSIEAALQNFFGMISFAATIIWSHPDEFKYPAAMSAGAVFFAAVLYAFFVRRRRGHLLHFDKALCGTAYWKSHFGENSRADIAWTRIPMEDEANT